MPLVNAPAVTPAGSHLFEVKFLGLTSEGGFFQKVSGIGRSVNVEQLEAGGVPESLPLIKGIPKMDQVTLEFGNMPAWELWQWASSVKPGGLLFRRDVLINHYEHQDMRLIRRFLLRNAFPVSWKASNLDANTNRLAVDSLTLAYDTLLMDITDLHFPSTTAVLKVDDPYLQSPPSKSVEFQFNPSKITVSRSGIWSPGEVTRNRDRREIKGVPAAHDTITFSKIIFDESRMYFSSVTDIVDDLYAMTVRYTTQTGESRPPLVRLTWSDNVFYGGISSLNYEYSQFTFMGTPQLAEVTLTLLGQVVGKGGAITVAPMPA